MILISILSGCEYQTSSQSESVIVEQSDFESTENSLILHCNDGEKLTISDEYISGYVMVKTKNFNGELSNNYAYLIGEVTNISDKPIEIDCYYNFEDSDFWSSSGMSHPCLLPGQSALIYSADETKDFENGVFEFSYDIYEVSDTYFNIYDSLNIASHNMTDGSLELEITSDYTGDVYGSVTIFYYDKDKNVVAVDESSGGGEFPFIEVFEYPRCDYSTFKICYVLEI